MRRQLSAVCLVAGVAIHLAAGDAVAANDPALGLAPIVVPAALANNPWPADLEAGLRERAMSLYSSEGRVRATNVGENEKGGYPMAFCLFLAGDATKQAEALAFLTSEDAEAGSDHAHTGGIDYYWSFTLKGQVRKYFLFGPRLGDAYKARMLAAAKLWTATDPYGGFEDVLLLDCPDAEVRAAALARLRVAKQTLDAALAGAEGERMKTSGAAADARILAIAAGQPTGDLGEDPARWRTWWTAYAEPGWEVFEEVERLMNPQPHPRYGHGQPGKIGKDFSPPARGFRVDGRNTDNLRAMRETSIYLLAEAAGSEVVRRTAKYRLIRSVRALYHTGWGEWDSENYAAHTTMPYHNLYDFAQDAEVRALGKAALDFLYTAQALKYRKGGFGGPTKRDYGGASRQWGSSPAQLLWLWAGDTPQPPHDQHADAMHAMTSAYRLPLAVRALIRKEFATPVELLDSKPTYTGWTPGADRAPEFFETMFYGSTYQLGSCVAAGTAGDVGNVKLLADTADGNVEYLLMNSGRRMVGMNDGDQVGQYRNLLIFLQRSGGQGISLQLPSGVLPLEPHDGRWIFSLQRCWVAMHAINIEGKRIGGGSQGRRGGATWILEPVGPGPSGLAFEIGDPKDFADQAAFAAAVAGRSKLDLSGLAGGRAALTGTAGATLAVTLDAASNLPRVERDGVARDWTREFDLYRPAQGDGPVSLGWKTGTLTVRAGGHVFTSTVTATGAASFRDE
jgi:hypothetical protein